MPCEGSGSTKSSPGVPRFMGELPFRGGSSLPLQCPLSPRFRGELPSSARLSGDRWAEKVLESDKAAEGALGNWIL